MVRNFSEVPLKFVLLGVFLISLLLAFFLSAFFGDFTGFSISNENESYGVFSHSPFDGEVNVSLNPSLEVNLSKNFSSSVVVEVLSGFSSIASGTDHTCAITNDSRVMCWGYDSYGSCGDGSLTLVQNPVLINTSEKFKSIYAYGRTSCGITLQDRVMCWGDGSFGQVGDGTTTFKQFNPTFVNTTEKFKSLSMGGKHVCGITLQDRVMCWGDGSSGQLGFGNATKKHYPVFVNTPEKFKFISSGGNHTCAITNNSKAMCWGDGSSGQLGYGGNQIQLNPVFVDTSQEFLEIHTSKWHVKPYTCGLTTLNKIMCWGSNANGRLGNVNVVLSTGDYYPSSLLVDSFIPVFAFSNERFSSLDVSWNHACGIYGDGTLACWGTNLEGRLGTGDEIMRAFPTPVETTHKFKSFTLGPEHTCGITISDKVMCWGLSIASGVQTGTFFPLQIDTNMSFDSVSGGHSFYCGLNLNGSAMCWGNGYHGELGNGASGYNGGSYLFPSPVFVRSLNNSFKPILFGIASLNSHYNFTNLSLNNLLPSTRYAWKIRVVDASEFFISPIFEFYTGLGEFIYASENVSLEDLNLTGEGNITLDDLNETLNETSNEIPNETLEDESIVEEIVEFIENVFSGSSGGGGGGGGSSRCEHNESYDWNCSSWSSCVNGVKTRECLEENNCGEEEGRPSVFGFCSQQENFNISLFLEKEFLESFEDLILTLVVELEGVEENTLDFEFIIENSTSEEIYYFRGNSSSLGELFENGFDNLNSYGGNYSLILKTFEHQEFKGEIRKPLSVRGPTLEELRLISDSLFFTGLLIGVIFIGLIIIILWRRRGKRMVLKDFDSF